MAKKNSNDKNQPTYPVSSEIKNSRAWAATQETQDRLEKMKAGATGEDYWSRAIRDYYKFYKWNGELPKTGGYEAAKQHQNEQGTLDDLCK